MDNPKVDVIVLAKSTEYLNQTLLSVIEQSYLPNIDVTVVLPQTAKFPNVKMLTKYMSIRCTKSKDKNLRQGGMDATKNPYFMFIKAGDLFGNTFSISSAVKQITDDKVARVDGVVFDQTGLISSERLAEVLTVPFIAGKLYSREFIKKFGIKFPPYEITCEAVFNQLVSFFTSQFPEYTVKTTDEATVSRMLVAKETYSEEDQMLAYLQNNNWVIDFLKSASDISEDAIKDRAGRLVAETYVWALENGFPATIRNCVKDIYKTREMPDPMDEVYHNAVYSAYCSGKLGNLIPNIDFKKWLEALDE